MKTSQAAETEGDKVTSWVSVCPRGLWEVCQSRKRGAEPTDPSGDVYPGIGSLCQVRVQRQGEPTADPELSLKPDLPIAVLSDAQVPPLQRSQDTMLQVPLGDWIILRLGEGQCDITEGCVEGMRAGEKCEVRRGSHTNSTTLNQHVPAITHSPFIQLVLTFHSFDPCVPR